MKNSHLQSQLTQVLFSPEYLLINSAKAQRKIRRLQSDKIERIINKTKTISAQNKTQKNKPHCFLRSKMCCKQRCCNCLIIFIQKKGLKTYRICFQQTQRFPGIFSAFAI